MKTQRYLLLALWLVGSNGHAQGFINLNFESATFQSDPISGFYPSAVYASTAIPGWTAYSAGVPQAEVLSNNISLSGGAVSVIGTNWVYPQIEGRYSVLLMGFNYPGFQYAVAIGQTGTVPVNAHSLIFWGYVGANDVSFNGQALSLAQLGSTPSYNIYGADISAFSGQTGELLFSTLGSATIDNIQFSTTIVPEPSNIGLAFLGTLVICLQRWKQRRFAR